MISQGRAAVERGVGCAMASRIVVVTGASGAGKTTVVTRLAERNLAGVTCAFFDSVGVPPPDEMPPDWQEKLGVLAPAVCFFTAGSASSR